MFLKKIFLDLDDVCNKFTMYALRYIGDTESESLDYCWYDPDWGYDIVKAANTLYSGGRKPPFTYNSFWSCFDQGFWASVPPSDEFSVLLVASRSFVGTENVCILTKPVPFPGCLEGKRQWIRKYLPKEMEHNYLIGEPKHLCASPDSLLIDDVEENVNKFRKHGGHAILFPRPWNKARSQDPYKYITERLTALEELKISYSKQGAA